MDIPSGAVRHLELMSKDEMAELVRHTGISSPLGLIQEIVNQAEGRPGLGAMLCQLCLRGDVAALATGDALASEVATVYGELVGEDVTPFLAAFSVAGDAGLSMQVVADYMDLPIHVLRERVSKLAAGGVLVEVDRERLAVRPPALRHALVRDVFFSGPTALQIEPLLAVQPSLDEAAETILGARHRGAQISDTLLRGLVERTGSRLAWLLYAQLGRREAEWIAAQHPERLLDTSTAVLDVAPDLVIPVLLEAAVGDHRRLNSSPDHPLRQLGDWVTAARPGSPSVVERRGQLRSAAAQWLEDDGDVEVGAHALALSLSPEFSRTDSEPGSGMAFVFSRGFITLEDARALRLEWPSVRDRLTQVSVEHWGPVRHLIEACSAKTSSAAGVSFLILGRGRWGHDIWLDPVPLWRLRATTGPIHESDGTPTGTPNSPKLVESQKRSREQPTP